MPVLNGGGRRATATSTQRDTGDVLVTFENEAAGIGAEFGADKFEVVYPKLSIEAEPPVAVVDKYADKHGTRKLAEAYLNFLYTPEGQAIIAKHDLRPRCNRAQGQCGKIPADRDLHGREAVQWLGQGAASSTSPTAASTTRSQSGNRRDRSRQ